ncbi:unnamed protein product, partial [Prorocentrum cordatum]
RLRRSDVLLQWADQGIDALNCLYGHAGAPPSAPANLGQQTSLNFLEDCYLGMGAMPSEPGFCEEALRELLSGSTVYAEDGGARVPCSKELVSWPEVGSSPVDLVGCLTQDDADWARDWPHNLLKTPDEALLGARQACPRGPFVDPRLARDPVLHGDFVRRLHQCGMLRFKVASTAKHMIGVFFARKKSGKLRIVFDTRYANAFFHPAPATRLPTAAAVSSVESGGLPLCVAAGDLDNAFYRLRPMSGLEDYFTLPPLSSSLAGIAELEGAVTMRAISVAGFADSQIAEDGRSSVALPARSDTAAAGYVGNFYVFGHDASLVTQRRDDVSAVLRGWGLTVHEETDASPDAVLVELRQGRWLSIKRRNLWRLRAALDTVLRRGCCSSKMLEVLVGHITWACLIRRELLCVLSSVYPYMAAGLPTTSRLWPSVRQELWLVRSLLPLLQKDLSSPWHDVVGVSDASEFGVGVAVRSARPDAAAQHGRQCERWRYRVHGAEKARERALRPQPLPSSAYATASLPAGLHGLDVLGLESFIRLHPREFMEVPKEFFDGAGSQGLTDALLPPSLAALVRGPLRLTGRHLQEPGSMAGASASRRQADRHRRAAAARQVASERGPSGGLSVLERTAVRPGTERLYQVYLRAFLQFCLVMAIDWTSEAEMDVALVTYLNSMYFEGRAPNEGSVLLASLAHYAPALYKRTAQALPRATRCLAGWRRRVPARMRLPLPRRAAFAIAGALAAWGQPRMGLFVMLSFAAYLRPQEAFRLAGRHLVPPVAHLGQAPTPWGLLLHDSDLQLPGKTNLWDESVLLDQAPWLEPALEALRTVAGDGPLWDFLPTSIAQLFEDACRALGLVHLQPHLYSLRHGGASEDLLSGARTPEQVMQRGRWATVASPRRYGKETRLLREAAKVDPDVLLFGEIVERDFLDVLRGGPLLPLAWADLPAS